jgi:hypothetical protein
VKYHLICCFSLLTLILVTGCAERRNPTTSGSGNALALLSRTPVRGEARSIGVARDTAYVFDYRYGISIYDLRDPAHPQLVDSMRLAGGDSLNVEHITVDSTGLLMAVTWLTTSSTLYNLKTKSNMNFPFGTSGVEKIRIYYNGQTLKTFRADINSTDGFFAVFYPNNGPPQAPSFSFNASFFANYYLPAQYGAWGFGWDPISNWVVSCHGLYGIALLDLNHILPMVPPSPELLSQLNTPGDTRDAAIVGNYVYLASGGSGLVVVDISNAAAPKVVGSLQMDNSPDIGRIEAVGNRVYMLDTFDGVFAVDVSNPTSPQLIGSLEASDALDFVIYNDLVVIADKDWGLIVGQIMY